MGYREIHEDKIFDRSIDRTIAPLNV